MISRDRSRCSWLFAMSSTTTLRRSWSIAPSCTSSIAAAVAATARVESSDHFWHSVRMFSSRSTSRMMRFVGKNNADCSSTSVEGCNGVEDGVGTAGLAGGGLA